MQLYSHNIQSQEKPPVQTKLFMNSMKCIQTHKSVFRLFVAQIIQKCRSTHVTSRCNIVFKSISFFYRGNGGEDYKARKNHTLTNKVKVLASQLPELLPRKNSTTGLWVLISLCCSYTSNSSNKYLKS